MITVVGSANIDFISHGERIPVAGETVDGTSFMATPGGKGANQAVAAGRLGAGVNILTCLGKKDRYRDLLTGGFRWAGVDSSGAEEIEEIFCGCALIMVDAEGSNIITIVPGANARIDSGYIERHRDKLEAADVALIDFGVPMDGVISAARIAKAAGAKVVVTPAPVRPLDEDLYGNISVLTPSMGEASALTGIEVTGEESARRSSEFFHRRGVETVVITMGEAGAFVSTASSLSSPRRGGRGNLLEVTDRLIPAYPVRAVDTTGGGDAFTGAFAFGLDRGDDVFEAARFACAAAALCVTKRGTTVAMHSRDEVERFLGERRREGIQP
ncbi:MAG: ribokinase [Spirochaetia bacterium]